MADAASPLPTLHGRLGPWRVVRRLGRGGVATVWEVLDPDTGQRAALKVANDRLASERAVQREYRALALLDHPGIVRVLGCGRLDGGAPYLLTELVVGQTSQARVRQEGPPGTPARALRAGRIVHDLVEALAYLHRRRMIHRDVKSSNVLATIEGHVKLLDLGAAAYEHGSAPPGPLRIPSGGAFAGTVVYASPEQLAGTPLDVRSDLFSVGVLWFRMLTGLLPFLATQREAAQQARRDGAPLDRVDGLPGLAVEARSLLGALLACDPDQRPADAAAVLASLRPSLATGGASPARLWPDPPPLCGRGAVIEILDRFCEGSGAGNLVVLDAAPGLGARALLGWVGGCARRVGARVVQPDLADEDAGGLLAGLLMAMPRHLRRGRSGPRGSLVTAAVDALLGLGGGRAVFLLLDGLERAAPAEVGDIARVLSAVAERGVDIRALAVRRPRPGEEPASLPAGVLRLPVGPLDDAATVVFARSLAGQRVLPAAVEAAVLRDGGGRPEAIAGALRALVDGARLRLAAAPEGAFAWVEAGVGADDAPSPPPAALTDLLARDADQAPWCAPEPMGAGGLPPSVLLGCEPEDLADPRQRAVVHLWRGVARQIAGDRDLQADADLLHADELLRDAEHRGWEAAGPWRTRLALARVAGLSARGRLLEARARLTGAPALPEGSAWSDLYEALARRLSRATGEPIPGDLPRPHAQAVLIAAAAADALQVGRLSAVEALTERGAPTDAWGHIDAADLAATRAAALRLRGDLGAARTVLAREHAAAGPGAPGPARVRVLLRLAELDLDGFRPGPCRERLVDAWVLLRHCDRPELAAERERLRGRNALVCGEPLRAEAALRTGMDVLRGTGLELKAARHACWLARALVRLGRRRDALALLDPAEGRLREAGARPDLALAALTRWELEGHAADPDPCFDPLSAWIEEEGALLPRLDWQLARLRHRVACDDAAGVVQARREARSTARAILRTLPAADAAVAELSPALRALGTGRAQGERR